MPDKKHIKEKDSALDPKVLNRAMGLLTAILDNKTPEALRVSMTEWFCSDWSMEEKYAALERIMHENLLPNYEYDPFAAQKLEELKERLKGELGKEKNISFMGNSRSNRPDFFKSIFRLVVILIPVLAITGLVYFGLIRKSADSSVYISEVTIETVEGVQKDIILPDGSHVWVNSGSKVTYPEQFVNERYVRLEGEAYFDIKHQTGKPFYVKTEHIDVKVLGTKFNVQASSDKEYTEVVLNEGSVEVKKGKNTSILKPEEKLTYNHNTGSMTIEHISEAKSEDWRSDVVYAKRKTLVQLFQVIENFYDTDIVYEEGKINNTELFTIALHKKESAEKVVSILSEMSGLFTVKIRDGKIYIEK